MPVTLAACTLFWVNWKWIVSISSASTAPSKESRAMPDTLGQDAQLFLVQRRNTERRLAPRLEHASVARTACGSVGQVLAGCVPLQFVPLLSTWLRVTCYWVHWAAHSPDTHASSTLCVQRGGRERGGGQRLCSQSGRRKLLESAAQVSLSGPSR